MEGPKQLTGESEFQDKVAVFWDYENARVWAEGIQVPLAERLMDLVKSHGIARVLKVYSNWRTDETIVQGLYSMGFQPIHVPMGKPNSVDVMLAVDCIASCWEHPDIGVYVLVSGDKDYIAVVNYLKTYGKHVIVVGPSEASSEHLQLSASEFYSFEGLAKEEDTLSRGQETISYEETIELLLSAIVIARDQGKPTRFPVLDQLMRGDDKSNYRGYRSIAHLDGNPFRSFGHLIKTAESDGKIVVTSTGVFAEVFLPGEDLTSESSYVPVSEEVLPEHWAIVLSEVERAFQEGKPGYLYGRFMLLYNYVRSKKKEGKLPVTNSTIKAMLSRLVDEGLLIRQDDESYRMAGDFNTKKNDFLKDVGS